MNRSRVQSYEGRPEICRPEPDSVNNQVVYKETEASISNFNGILQKKIEKTS